MLLLLLACAAPAPSSAGPRLVFALDVIRHLKETVASIGAGLPSGVTLSAVYDRSQLIHRAIDTLRSTLVEESLIVALVCLAFLLHARSALVAILMLPVGVLVAFIAMRLLGLNSNLMSLGGIAIAIGAMVDAAIVMIENAHRHLERRAPEELRDGGRHRLLRRTRGVPLRGGSGRRRRGGRRLRHRGHRRGRPAPAQHAVDPVTDTHDDLPAARAALMKVYAWSEPSPT